VCTCQCCKNHAVYISLGDLGVLISYLYPLERRASCTFIICVTTQCTDGILGASFILKLITVSKPRVHDVLSL